MTWNMPDDLPPSGGTFFHLSAYWRTLQQRRSRTYVSVIRRKWIRPKRKPTRALNCKKVGRAQICSAVYSGKRESLSFPCVYRLYSYFSPYIYPSIYLSAFRSPIIFTPMRDRLFLPPLFLPPFFSPVSTVFQFRSLSPVVVFTRLSLANGYMSIALTRFSQIQ